MPSAAASKIASETGIHFGGVLIHNLSEVIVDTFIDNHTLVLDILSYLS